MYRQSSDTGTVIHVSGGCMHRLGCCVAFQTLLHAAFATGARQRSDPNGGSAYGIPRKLDDPSPLATPAAGKRIRDRDSTVTSTLSRETCEPRRVRAPVNLYNASVFEMRQFVPSTGPEGVTTVG